MEIAFLSEAITYQLQEKLPLSLTVAKRCAQLRERLRQEGKRVKAQALDLMTAAIALENNLMLVTRNVADYKDIRGLKLYKAS